MQTQEVVTKITCPRCQIERDFSGTRYNDMWIQFLDENGPVEIKCPTMNADNPCLISEPLALEEPRPDRFELTVGKHAGLRLTEVDESYIAWLEKSNQEDLLLKACINKLN